MPTKNLFEIFGENAPPSPLKAIFEVEAQKKEAASFSYSPDDPEPSPNPDLKEESQAVKSTVSDAPTVITTDNNSAKILDNNEEIERAAAHNPDFGSLIQEAENIADMARTFESALTQEQIHWRGTAHILSTLLQDHVRKLKAFDTATLLFNRNNGIHTELQLSKTISTR